MIENLGRYGQVTTKAAKAGGMDKYLRRIEIGGALKAAPIFFLGGYIAKAQMLRAERAKKTLTRPTLIDVTGLKDQHGEEITDVGTPPTGGGSQ